MRVKKKILLSSLIAVSLFALAGCSVSADDQEPLDPEPTTSAEVLDTETFTVEDGGISLSTETPAANLIVSFDEAALPAGFVPEGTPQEDIVSGNESDKPAEGKYISFRKEDTNCFASAVAQGEIIPDRDSNSLTEAVLDEMLEEYETDGSFLATVKTDDGKNVEMIVAKLLIADSIVYTGYRVFDTDVVDVAESESGEKLSGKEMLTVTYSCDDASPEDYQNFLNAINITL